MGKDIIGILYPINGKTNLSQSKNNFKAIKKQIPIILLTKNPGTEALDIHNIPAVKNSKQLNLLPSFNGHNGFHKLFTSIFKAHYYYFTLDLTFRRAIMQVNAVRKAERETYRR